MSGHLTDADRLDLIETVLSKASSSGIGGADLGNAIVDAVEVIIARHRQVAVAAALNAAADAIEATCPPERTDAAHGRLDAARIVRNRATT